jgi:hypothetical protein
MRHETLAGCQRRRERHSIGPSTSLPLRICQVITLSHYESFHPAQLSFFTRTTRSIQVRRIASRDNSAQSILGPGFLPAFPIISEFLSIALKLVGMGTHTYYHRLTSTFSSNFLYSFQHCLPNNSDPHSLHRRWYCLCSWYSAHNTALENSRRYIRSCFRRSRLVRSKGLI